MPEFAFIGRSNVGKSSLLNMLTGRKGLARVSATPGFTKLINVFTINRTWRLVDLPGYGYAQVARKDKARFNAAVNEYLEKRRNLRGLFMLIDSRLPPQQIDLEFLEWLGCISAPIVLVFTKADELSPTKLRENIATFTAEAARWFAELPDVIATSAVTSQGRRELLEAIEAAIAPPAPAAPANTDPRADIRADAAPALVSPGLPTRRTAAANVVRKRPGSSRPW